MRITKFGHACVRIEHDGQVRRHRPRRLHRARGRRRRHRRAGHPRAPRPPRRGHLARHRRPGVDDPGGPDQIAEADPAVAERVQVVAPGQQFDAGLPVTAVGELHAVIHQDLPRFHNSGFVLDVPAPGSTTRATRSPRPAARRRTAAAGARAVEQDLRGRRLRRSVGATGRWRSTTGCSTTPARHHQPEPQAAAARDRLRAAAQAPRPYALTERPRGPWPNGVTRMVPVAYRTPPARAHRETGPRPPGTGMVGRRRRRRRGR